MPRETVAEFSIEYVRVLEEDGAADESLLPDLADDDLAAMYETMKRVRRLDEKAVALQRRGEIGTYAPAVGQEAAQVGSAFALRESDWLVPSFREHPALLTRGASMAAILIYAAGLEEGAAVPADARFLPPAIPVGSQATHAAGVGWGQAIRGEEAATIGYFGDGATSEGDVAEAMNVAGVLGSKTVFWCQNNQYAISVPRAAQSRAETLAQKAVAAGIHGVQVDGNDVLGSYLVADEALDRARGGDASMVEALTYRRSMHTTSDDPTVYRDRDEEADWEERDPIDRFEHYLRDEGLLDDETVAAIEAEVEAELDEAVERMESARDATDPAEMFEYAFAELPPELQRQREAFAAERAEARAGEGEEGDGR